MIAGNIVIGGRVTVSQTRTMRLVQLHFAPPVDTRIIDNILI